MSLALVFGWGFVQVGWRRLWALFSAADGGSAAWGCERGDAADAELSYDGWMFMLCFGCDILMDVPLLRRRALFSVGQVDEFTTCQAVEAGACCVRLAPWPTVNRHDDLIWRAERSYIARPCCRRAAAGNKGQKMKQNPQRSGRLQAGSAEQLVPALYDPSCEFGRPLCVL